MNFITYDAAYSLYPYATFEQRRALSLAKDCKRDEEAIAKYCLRGWTIVSNLSPPDTADMRQFHPHVARHLSDRFVWKLPLDTHGVCNGPSLLADPAPPPRRPALGLRWLLNECRVPPSLDIRFRIIRPSSTLGV